MPINDTTPGGLALPLPNKANTLLHDVQRLRDAIAAIEAQLVAKATLEDIQDAIDQLLNGAPGALDTINELATALGNDPNFATTIITALADKMPNVTATPSRLGGVKVGAGLVVDGDGTLSTSGGGEGGTGLPAYDEMVITPTINGQTIFTVSGGYIAGQLEVHLNGALLYGNGDDYTAANGTTFTLTEGVNTTDALLIKRWKYLPSANAVNKLGDTMAGALLLASDPIAAMQASTKQYVDALKAYVDNLVAGLKPKASVKAATTASIGLSGAQTIDGVSIVAGDRVLVRAQSTASQNGIYVAAAGAWTRATDADSWVELVSAIVMVEQGTTLADSGWVCTIDQGGVINTGAVTFVRFVGGFVTPTQVPALSALPVELIGTNTVSTAGKHYVLTAGGLTLVLPASPAKDDMVQVTNASGTLTPVIDFNGQLLRGQIPGTMIMDVPTITLQYSGNVTYGWV